MAKRKGRQSVSELLKAFESKALTVTFADDYGLLPPVHTHFPTDLGPSDPKGIKETLRDCLVRIVQNCVKLAEETAERVVGENWKKLFQLRNAIEIERIRDGLTRDGKTLKGDIENPDWIKDILPALSNVDRDYVMVASDLALSAGRALYQLESKKPDPVVLGCACMQMGVAESQLALMKRSKLVEEGLEAKSRPKRAAEAKSRKATARHSELAMAYKKHLAQAHGMVMLAMKKTADDFGVTIDTVRRARRKKSG
jgi:hypothetical protein